MEAIRAKCRIGQCGCDPLLAPVEPYRLGTMGANESGLDNGFIDADSLRERLGLKLWTGKFAPGPAGDRV